MNFACAHTELVDLNRLIPNPKNNNRHSIEQIKRLSKIIDYQGQRAPIVISNRTGFIVKGHARLEAIKLLGWEKAAVDYQDYESEAQEYADMTADNEIARWAELDTSLMLDEIKGFDDFDIELLGIKDFTLDILPEIDLEEGETKDNPEIKHIIEVSFSNDMDKQDLYDDLVSKGYAVKIK